MAGLITIQLPDEVLIEALQQLTPERRRQLLRQLDTELRINAVPFPSDALNQLTGIIKAGGDALEESERLYDE
jgi:hypothetical protein